MLKNKQILKDLQLSNQAQEVQVMEKKRKNFMSHKYLKNSIKCITEMQNLNKCLESSQIDIL
jgi:hypothetical protein